jgi:23S rRNA (uracil1939-C5)-methyltransferase
MVLTREAGGETFRYDARAFFQVNPGVVPALLEEVFRDVHVPEPGHRTLRGLALDLYAGIGLLTVPLARRFTNVLALESEPVAAAYAEQNVAAAGLRNVRVRAARVEQWLPPNARHLGRVPFALLDPPRTGAEGVMGALLAAMPDRIVYVSCDPATLSRDLQVLLEGGYTLDRVAALDMFPQTHHVEVVAHLTPTAPEA